MKDDMFKIVLLLVVSTGMMAIVYILMKILNLFSWVGELFNWVS